MLLFNWIGYRLYTSFLENRLNAQFETQLDNNYYDESQLISIKVPVSHFAYYNNSSLFERVDGQVEVNGVVYKFVKRRLYKDSLELLCLPNHDAMKLASAKDEFFKLVNDLQSDTQTKKSDSHKDISKVFSSDNYTPGNFFELKNFNSSISIRLPFYSENLISSYSFTDEQPPDLF